MAVLVNEGVAFAAGDQPTITGNAAAPPTSRAAATLIRTGRYQGAFRALGITSIIALSRWSYYGALRELTEPADSPRRNVRPVAELDKSFKEMVAKGGIEPTRGFSVAGTAALAARKSKTRQSLSAGVGRGRA
jgi:hypothetical protein